MTKLFSHPLGWVAVIAALILDLIGGFFIYKIVSIKV
jgi:Flp pilus assembly protein TadB